MRKRNVLPSLKGFSKYVVIPVICYIPAYIFVHTVFSFQENSWVTVAKTIPAEPNTKALSDQVDALSTRINILEKMKGIQGEDLQEKYVKGLIESEAEKQAKETVKDKTDQLKGELFGQIAFPVLAAIVSIFTAFVVKDAVLELLKKDEKDKLIEELNLKVEKHNKELNEKFSLGESSLTKKFEEEQKELKEIIDKSIERTVQSNLQLIKTRIGWLEYLHSSLESKSLLDNSFSSPYIKSIVMESRSLMINTIERLKDIVQDPDSFKMIDAYEKTLLLTFARKHEISEDISSILDPKGSQYDSERKSWLDYHVDIRATQLKQMIDDLYKCDAITEIEKNALLDILSRYNSKIDHVLNVRQEVEELRPALEDIDNRIPPHMWTK